MTKQHYIKIAASIKQIKSRQSREDAAEAFARVGIADNPRFDVSRFKEACGL
jgi:hypothetical protein